PMRVLHVSAGASVVLARREETREVECGNSRHHRRGVELSPQVPTEDWRLRMRVLWTISIVSVLVICLVLGAGPGTAAPNAIVIYSGMDEYTMNVLTKAFEPMTGMKVESLILAAAGTMASRVRSEASARRADIFLGGSVEIHEPLARDGLLVPYHAPEEASGKIPSEYIDPRGLWDGFYAGPLVIIVNRSLDDQE